jgi:hypothetical protein
MPLSQCCDDKPVMLTLTLQSLPSCRVVSGSTVSTEERRRGEGMGWRKCPVPLPNTNYLRYGKRGKGLFLCTDAVQAQYTSTPSHTWRACSTTLSFFVVHGSCLDPFLPPSQFSLAPFRREPSAPLHRGETRRQKGVPGRPLSLSSTQAGQGGYLGDRRTRPICRRGMVFTKGVNYRGHSFRSLFPSLVVALDPFLSCFHSFLTVLLKRHMHTHTHHTHTRTHTNTSKPKALPYSTSPGRADRLWLSVQ